MNQMTTHMFPTYNHRGQKRYMARYLQKPLGMKVKMFTTRLVQLDEYLPYFTLDTPNQTVAKLPIDFVPRDAELVEKGYGRARVLLECSFH